MGTEALYCVRCGQFVEEPSATNVCVSCASPDPAAHKLLCEVVGWNPDHPEATWEAVLEEVRQRDAAWCEHRRELQDARGCLKSGPGRGDCFHFVGMPAALDGTTTDEHGVPHGWCIVCWLSHKIAVGAEA